MSPAVVSYHQERVVRLERLDIPSMIYNDDNDKFVSVSIAMMMYLSHWIWKRGCPITLHSPITPINRLYVQLLLLAIVHVLLSSADSAR